MTFRTFTAMLVGLKPIQIDVEVDGNQGVPQLLFIGLTSQATEEAKERITTALLNCGVRMRSKRTVVNLAPAEVPKSGSGFDLAIAIGLLKMYGEVELNTDDTLFLGELSLDGKLRKIRGALPLILAAKSFGFKKVILPYANAAEVAIISEIALFPIHHLNDYLAFARVQEPLHPLKQELFHPPIFPSPQEVDFADIRGQEYAKRALLIAAAGGHHILLNGAPGIGKSYMAKAFRSILPPLTETEAIEVTTIHSVYGTNENGLVTEAPFRAPHHTTSTSGLIGGGTQLRPGEISLAHRGVLFLDEFLEFHQTAIEALRQPLEDGYIALSRALGSTTFPAKFMLIAATNPCPCGYSGSTKKACTCSKQVVNHYLKKLSGPIFDRFDLHVPVREIELEKLTQHRATTAITSEYYKEQVAQARRKQQKRYVDQSFSLNSELPSKFASKLISFSTSGLIALNRSVVKHQLSGRGYFKLIKVSQTVADLEVSAVGSQIEERHVAEAVQYR